MYDTVNFWISRDFLPCDPFYYERYLQNPIRKTNKLGMMYIVGHIKNYTVEIHEDRIYLYGSLAKYWYGLNVNSLDIKETALAIEKLSNELNINLFCAKVVRFDIGSTFVMDYPLKNYFSRLIQKKFFRRESIVEETIYFKTLKRWLSFYNKGKEMRMKNIKHLLKYEISFAKELSRQFGRTITGATLIDAIFYNKVITIWKDEYLSIKKSKSISIQKGKGIKTPKDVYPALLGFFIRKEDPNFIENLIQDLKQEGLFEDPKYYTRIKKKLYDYTCDNTFESTDKYIRELDMKIIKCAEKHLIKQEMEMLYNNSVDLPKFGKE